MFKKALSRAAISSLAIFSAYAESTALDSHLGATNRSLAGNAGGLFVSGTTGVVAVPTSNLVNLFDITTGNIFGTVTFTNQPITGVAISGTLGVAGFNVNPFVRSFNVQTGAIVAQASGQYAPNASDLNMALSGSIALQTNSTNWLDGFDAINGGAIQLYDVSMPGLTTINAIAADPSTIVMSSDNGLLGFASATVTTPTLLATMTAGSNPKGVAFSGTTGIVANYGSNNVTIFNVETRTPLATVSVGSGPWGVAISGTNALVANSLSNNVSVIDLTSNQVINTLFISGAPKYVGLSGTYGVVGRSSGSQLTFFNIYEPIGTPTGTTLTWSGAGTVWSNASNWNPNQEPTDIDRAVFPSNLSSNVFFPSGGNIGSISIQGTAVFNGQPVTTNLNLFPLGGVALDVRAPLTATANMTFGLNSSGTVQISSVLTMGSQSFIQGNTSPTNLNIVGTGSLFMNNAYIDFNDPARRFREVTVNLASVNLNNNSRIGRFSDTVTLNGVNVFLNTNSWIGENSNGTINESVNFTNSNISMTSGILAYVFNATSTLNISNCFLDNTGGEVGFSQSNASSRGNLNVNILNSNFNRAYSRIGAYFGTSSGTTTLTNVSINDLRARLGDYSSIGTTSLILNNCNIRSLITNSVYVIGRPSVFGNNTLIRLNGGTYTSGALFRIGQYSGGATGGASGSVVLTGTVNLLNNDLISYAFNGPAVLDGILESGSITNNNRIFGRQAGVTGQTWILGGSITNNSVIELNLGNASNGAPSSGSLTMSGGRIVNSGAYGVANSNARLNMNLLGGTVINNNNIGEVYDSCNATITIGGNFELVNQGQVGVTFSPSSVDLKVYVLGGSITNTPNSNLGRFCQLNGSATGFLQIGGSSSFYNDRGESQLSYSSGLGQILISGGSITNNAVFSPQYQTGFIGHYVNGARGSITISGGTINNIGRIAEFGGSGNSSGSINILGAPVIINSGELGICYDNTRSVMTISGGSIFNSGQINSVQSPGASATTTISGSAIITNNGGLGESFGGGTSRVFMTGGSIYNNGGMADRAIIFSMSGGLINNVNTIGWGAGTIQISGGTYTNDTSSATIGERQAGYSGNTIISGGRIINAGRIGFYNEGTGDFTIQGNPEITNTQAMAQYSAQGLGNLTISGGSISNSFVLGFNPSLFTMTGGSILNTGDIATNAGTFSMQGGTITIANPVASLAFGANTAEIGSLAYILNGTDSSNGGNDVFSSVGTIAVSGGQIVQNSGFFAPLTQRLSLNSGASITNNSPGIIGPVAFDLTGGSLLNNGTVIFDQVSGSPFARLSPVGTLSSGSFDGAGDLWVAGTLTSNMVINQGRIFIGQGVNGSIANQLAVASPTSARFVANQNPNSQIIVTSQGVFDVATGAINNATITNSGSVTSSQQVLSLTNGSITNTSSGAFGNNLGTLTLTNVNFANSGALGASASNVAISGGSYTLSSGSKVAENAGSVSVVNLHFNNVVGSEIATGASSFNLINATCVNAGSIAAASQNVSISSTGSMTNTGDVAVNAQTVNFAGGEFFNNGNFANGTLVSLSLTGGSIANTGLIAASASHLVIENMTLNQMGGDLALYLKNTATVSSGAQITQDASSIFGPANLAMTGGTFVNNGTIFLDNFPYATSRAAGHSILSGGSLLGSGQLWIAGTLTQQVPMTQNTIYIGRAISGAGNLSGVNYAGELVSSATITGTVDVSSLGVYKVSPSLTLASGTIFNSGLIIPSTPASTLVFDGVNFVNNAQGVVGLLNTSSILFKGGQINAGGKIGQGITLLSLEGGEFTFPVGGTLGYSAQSVAVGTISGTIPDGYSFAEYSSNVSFINPNFENSGDLANYANGTISILGGTIVNTNLALFGYNSANVLMTGGQLTNQIGASSLQFLSGTLNLSSAGQILNNINANLGPFQLSMTGGSIANSGLVTLDNINLSGGVLSSRGAANSVISGGAFTGSGDVWIAGTLTLSSTITQSNLYVGRSYALGTTALVPSNAFGTLIIQNNPQLNTVINITGSGTLAIEGSITSGSINNSGQIITSGGVIEIAGAQLTNSAPSSIGANSTVIISSGTVINDPGASIATGGTFTLKTSGVLQNSGSVGFLGKTITISANGLTQSGTGSLGFYADQIVINTNASITNGALMGPAPFNLTTGCTLINNGTLIAGSLSTIDGTLTGSGQLWITGSFTHANPINQGRFVIGQTLNQTSGSIENTSITMDYDNGINAVYVVGGSSTLNMPSSVYSTGTVENYGTLSFPSTYLAVTGGSLSNMQGGRLASSYATVTLSDGYFFNDGKFAQGAGTLTLTGSGQLLTGTNSYIGTTNMVMNSTSSKLINNGILVVDQGSFLQGSISGSGSMYIVGSATFAGTAVMGPIVQGTIYVGYLPPSQLGDENVRATIEARIRNNDNGNNIDVSSQGIIVTDAIIGQTLSVAGKIESGVTIFPIQNASLDLEGSAEIIGVSEYDITGASYLGNRTQLFAEEAVAVRVGQDNSNPTATEIFNAAGARFAEAAEGVEFFSGYVQNFGFMAENASVVEIADGEHYNDDYAQFATDVLTLGITGGNIENRGEFNVSSTGLLRSFAAPVSRTTTYTGGTFQNSGTAFVGLTSFTIGAAPSGARLVAGTPCFISNAPTSTFISNCQRVVIQEASVQNSGICAVDSVDLEVLSGDIYNNDRFAVNVDEVTIGRASSVNDVGAFRPCFVSNASNAIMVSNCRTVTVQNMNMTNSGRCFIATDDVTSNLTMRSGQFNNTGGTAGENLDSATIGEVANPVSCYLANATNANLFVNCSTVRIQETTVTNSGNCGLATLEGSSDELNVISGAYNNESGVTGQNLNRVAFGVPTPLLQDSVVYSNLSITNGSSGTIGLNCNQVVVYNGSIVNRGFIGVSSADALRALTVAPTGTLQIVKGSLTNFGTVGLNVARVIIGSSTSLSGLQAGIDVEVFQESGAAMAVNATDVQITGAAITAAANTAVVKTEAGQPAFSVVISESTIDTAGGAIEGDGDGSSYIGQSTVIAQPQARVVSDVARAEVEFSVITNALGASTHINVIRATVNQTQVYNSGDAYSGNKPLNTASLDVLRLFEFDSRDPSLLTITQGSISNLATGTFAHNFDSVLFNSGTLTNLGTVFNNIGTLSIVTGVFDNSGVFGNLVDNMNLQGGLWTLNSGSKLAINSGSITFGSGLVLSNPQGAMIASNSGTLYMNGSLANSGLLGPVALQLTSGTIANSGTIALGGINNPGISNIGASGVLNGSGELWISGTCNLTNTIAQTQVTIGKGFASDMSSTQNLNGRLNLLGTVNGTLQVTGSGYLNLQLGTFSQGVIVADASGVVNSTLGRLAITGGSISSSGQFGQGLGTLSFSGGTFVSTNAGDVGANASLVLLQNGANVSSGGNFATSATLSMTGGLLTASGGSVGFNAPLVTLSGGTINLNNANFALGAGALSMPGAAKVFVDGLSSVGPVPLSLGSGSITNNGTMVVVANSTMPNSSSLNGVGQLWIAGTCDINTTVSQGLVVVGRSAANTLPLTAQNASAYVSTSEAISADINVLSGGVLSLNYSSVINGGSYTNAGLLTTTQNNFSISGGTLNNSGTVGISGANLVISNAASIINSGAVGSQAASVNMSGGKIHILTGGRFGSNAVGLSLLGGTVIADLGALIGPSQLSFSAGSLTNNGTLCSSGNSLINNSAQMNGSGEFWVSGTTTLNTSITQTQVVVGKNLTGPVFGKLILNGTVNGTIVTTSLGVIETSSGTFSSGNFDLTGITTSSTNSLAVTGANISNRGQFGNDINTVTLAGGVFNNYSSGQIAVGAVNLLIQSPEVLNNYGGVVGDNTQKINMSGGAVNNNSPIAFEGYAVTPQSGDLFAGATNVTISGGTIDLNFGSLASDAGAVTISSPAQINNNALARIGPAPINMTGGAIANNSRMYLKGVSALTGGSISGNGSISITGSATLNINVGQNIITVGNGFKAAELLGDVVDFGNLFVSETNNRTIFITTSGALYTPLVNGGTIDNSGTIGANPFGNNMTLSSGSISNRQTGKLTTAGSMLFSGSEIYNSGQVGFRAGTISMTSGSIYNSSALLARGAQGLLVQASGYITSDASSIIGPVPVGLSGGSLINQGTMSITGSSSITAETLQGAGQLWVAGTCLLNSSLTQNAVIIGQSFVSDTSNSSAPSLGYFNLAGTINAPVTILQLGTLDFNLGQVTNGTYSNYGKMTSKLNQLALSGGSIVNFAGGIIGPNLGTVSITSTVTNLSGATLSSNTDLTLMQDGAYIDNYGEFSWGAGKKTILSGGLLNNYSSGTVATNGSLTLTDDAAVLNSGLFVSGPQSSFYISGGSLTNSQDAGLSSGTVAVSQGYINNQGRFANLANGVSITGGTWSLSQGSQLARQANVVNFDKLSLVVPVGAEVGFDAKSVIFGSVSLTNNGSVAQFADQILINAGSYTNSGGIFATNAGTLTMAGGRIQNQAGSFASLSGPIYLQSGFISNEAEFAQNASYLELSTANIDVENHASFGVLSTHLKVLNGTLFNNTNARFGDQATLVEVQGGQITNRSTLAGSAHNVVIAGGNWSLLGNSFVANNAGTLTIGSVTLANPVSGQIGTGATVVNLASAMISNSGLLASSAKNVFITAGTYSNSGTMADLSVIVAQGGSISNSGSFGYNAITSMVGAYADNQGNFATGTLAQLSINAGTVNNLAQMAQNALAATVSGGYLLNSAGAFGQGGSLVSMLGAANIVNNASFAQNAATCSLTGGLLTNASSATLGRNAAYVIIAGSAQVVNNLGGFVGPSQIMLEGTLSQLTNNGSIFLGNNSELIYGSVSGLGEIWTQGTVHFHTPITQNRVVVGQSYSWPDVGNAVSEAYLTSIINAPVVVTGSGSLISLGTVSGSLTLEAKGLFTPGGYTDPTNDAKVVGQLRLKADSTTRMDFGLDGNDKILVYDGDVILGDGSSKANLSLFADPTRRYRKGERFVLMELAGLPNSQAESLGAAGVIQGEFNLIKAQPLLFFNLSYEPPEAPTQLVLTGGYAPFTEFANTPNQVAVATLLDALAENPDTNICMKDKIGEMQFQIFVAPVDAALSTMESSEFKGQQVVLEELSFIINDELSEALYHQHKGYKAFVAAGYENVRQDGYSQYSGYKSNAFYQLGGFTYGYTETQMMLALGALETKTTYTAQPAKSSSSSVLAAFGASHNQTRWSYGIDGLFGYHYFKTSRTIDLFNLNARSIHSGFSAKVQGRGSYKTSYKNAYALVYDDVGFYYGYENKYSEEGAECLSLAVNASHRSMVRNTLGFKVASTMSQVVRPYIDVAYVYEKRFTGRSYIQSFVGSPGSMHVEGIEMPLNYGKLQCGVEGTKGKWDYKFNFLGMWSKGFQEAGGSVHLERKF